MNTSPSIKKNYLYNSILTTVGFVFPLITFPYVTRVLGPEGIGKVKFAESIVVYFVTLANLGIPMYGIREIAKVRDNQEKLNKVFTELFVVNIVSMILATIFFSILFVFVHKIQEEKLLFVIMGVTIFLNVFSIDWFFRGMENYRYISLRSLFALSFSLILLFVFVKSAEDYIIYAGITVVASSGIKILNIFYRRNFVKFVFNELNLKRHVKPILVFFSTTIAISIYLNLDIVMLGFLSGDRYVGLYTAAIKPIKIVTAIIASLGVVLVPRLSYYLSAKNFFQFEELSKKSLNFVFFFSIPCSIMIFLLADEIILLLTGNLFISASITLKLLSVLIIFLVISNFYSLQILVPQNKEKYVLYITISAAVVNIVLNFLLIPQYHHNGAAIATLLAEFVATILNIYFVKNYYKVRLFSKEYLMLLLISLTFIPIITFIKYFFHNTIIVLSLSSVCCAIVYLSFSYYIKNEILLLINEQLKKFKR